MLFTVSYLPRLQLPTHDVAGMGRRTTLDVSGKSKAFSTFCANVKLWCTRETATSLHQGERERLSGVRCLVCVCVRDDGL